MPRRLDPKDPNVLVRNNLGASKLSNKRPFNPRNSNNETPTPNSVTGRSSMVVSGIFGGIFMLVVLFVCFLVTHFETNRHLRDITQNIDKSRIDLLNLTKHLSMMNEDFRVGGFYRPPMAGHAKHRIDYAQFALGAKVIKFQGVELPINGPSNEHVRSLFGLTVPKSACNILGEYLNRKSFLMMKGNQGIITIRLHQAILPDTIRIDHYIEDLKDFNQVKAMPKEVAVYGIRTTGNDQVAVPLGKMRMIANLHSKPQSGIIHIKPSEPFDVYKLEILSNNGNPDYTRLYKVRIYGNVNNS